MLKNLFPNYGNPEDLRNIFDKDAGRVKNILIVRQHNQLGDMLCSVPLFAAIRKKFPGSHISLVASPVNYEILFNDINPYIDHVITYRKAPFRELAEFYGELKNNNYQIGIVPSTVSISRTSHLINYFSGAKIRVGVRSIDEKFNKMEYLLNVKSDFKWDEKKLNQVERNLDVGRQIGCDLTKEELEEVRIHLSKDELEFADKFIHDNFPDTSKLILAFHPGAGKIPNRWNRDNFISLMKMMNERFDCYLMMTSGTIDREITNGIRKDLSELGIECTVLEDTPIRKVGAVISKTDLYVTNDTGTLHVAGGVNANIVSLFGPTHGYEWAPVGKNKIFIQSPTDNIDDIKVEKVFEESSGLLLSLGKIKSKVTVSVKS